MLRWYALDLGLAASLTSFKSHGKGPKVELRFSKTGNPAIEEAWRRRFSARKPAVAPPPDPRPETPEAGSSQQHPPGPTPASNPQGIA